VSVECKPAPQRRTVHMWVDISGVLRWPDKKLSGMFQDEFGNNQPGRVVREYLRIQLAHGKKVLPIGECEGFSFETGCPGHFVTDEKGSK